MPPVILDRIPLPSLQTYTAVSVLLLSSAIYYAIQMTSDPEWLISVEENVNISDVNNENQTEPMESVKFLLQNLLKNDVITERLYEITLFIAEDSFCVWVSI